MLEALKNLMGICDTTLNRPTRQHKHPLSKEIPISSDTFTKILIKHDVTIFSPFSINYALGSLSFGTSDSVKSEFVKMIGIFAHLDQLKRLKNELVKSGCVAFESISLTKHDSVQSQQFYDILRSLGQFDQFDRGNLQDVVTRVNTLVATTTQGTIKEIINIGHLNRNTCLVIANAIYFQCDWKYGFDKDSTRKKEFHLPNGRIVNVDLMHQKLKSCVYYSDNNAQVVELPYTSKGLVMVIVLPRIGKTVDAIDYLSISSFVETRTTKIDLHLPKFSVDKTYELTRVISQTSLASILSPGSITAISPDAFVSNIVHKVHVTVDEVGTVASAATALMVMSKSFHSEDEYVVFNCNRKFYWSIMLDDEMLFYGQYDGPSESI